MGTTPRLLAVGFCALITVARAPVPAAANPAATTTNGACQAHSGPGAQAIGPTRERLVVRIEQFWKAWQLRNLHQVYLLFAPSYRKDTPETAFYEVTRGMLNISPVAYTIAKIEIDADRRKATAVLDAKSVVLPLGEVPNTLTMRWVYEEGDWYREMTPQEPIIPPKPPDGLR